MNINKKISQDNEIDIKEFIKTFWKKKFYVLIITLSFTVASYTYSTNQNKLYQTKIFINKSAVYQLNFKTNLFLLENQRLKDYNNFFIIIFQQKLLSFDHLIKFAKQYDQLDEFTSYLKKKNITIEDYFYGKFRSVFKKKNNINHTYVLDFTKPFPGQKFLNDYIIFTKKTANIEVIKILESDLRDLTLVYKKQIEIAKDIDLVTPMPQVIPERVSNLFYKGVIVLNNELKIIKELIDQIENFSLKQNLIVDEATRPIQISKSNLFYVSFGIATGLFLSIFIIFFINTQRKGV